MSSSVEKMPEILDLLSKTAPNISVSPTFIAKKIKTDSRTLMKILGVLVKLDIVDIDVLERQSQTVRGFRLSDKYRKFVLDK